MSTIVVMPAYNAEKTVEKTCQSLPKVYDQIILCDDASRDETAKVSSELGITTLRHAENRGYGANQKTLYDKALKDDPEIIVMVHPDNQYNTKNLPGMIEQIRNGAHLVLGTRMKTALLNNMPIWKYAGNKFLTFFQNLVFKTKLSEFHSGLRVYNAAMLKVMPYNKFSDDFVFDSEVLAWARANGYTVDEHDTECYYNDTVSSINFKRSVIYGMSTLGVLYKYLRGKYKSK